MYCAITYLNSLRYSCFDAVGHCNRPTRSGSYITVCRRRYPVLPVSSGEVLEPFRIPGFCATETDIIINRHKIIEKEGKL